MNERVWPMMEVLSAAHRYLDEKGIESPRRSAEALLGKVMGLPPIELYLQHDRPLSGEQLSAYRELLRRRSQHEPLQLLLGTIEFCGVNLDVVPGLLIPRPETEELADFASREMAKFENISPLRVLDIGTGTGCLAVAIAARVLHANVDAVDIDFEALRCAGRNAVLNGVENRVQCLFGDVLSDRFLSQVQTPYDVVISNPPYIKESEFAGLDAEVREHEPRHALVAAENGLAFYRRIALLLPVLLKPEGFVAVEVGIGQAEAVTELFCSAMRRTSVHNDMSGIPRIVAGYCLEELSSNGSI